MTTAAASLPTTLLEAHQSLHHRARTTTKMIEVAVARVRIGSNRMLGQITSVPPVRKVTATNPVQAGIIEDPKGAWTR